MRAFVTGYALWHYLKFLPGVYPVYPPYCFECMIALIKVDKFPNKKFEMTLPFFSGPLLEVLLPADSMRTDGFSFTAYFRSL